MPSSAWSSDVCSSDRSEEHTSELQSLTNLVCRLLLGTEKHTSELQSLTNLLCRLLIEKPSRRKTARCVTTSSSLMRSSGWTERSLICSRRNSQTIPQLRD